MDEKKLTVYVTIKKNVKIVQKIQDETGKLKGAKVILDKDFVTKKITNL